MPWRGLRHERRFILRAVHVNHGLQLAAEDWEEHCAALAGRLDVPYSRAPRSPCGTTGARGSRPRPGRRATPPSGRTSAGRGVAADRAPRRRPAGNRPAAPVPRFRGRAGWRGFPATRPLVRAGSAGRSSTCLRRHWLPTRPRCLLPAGPCTGSTDPMNADPAYDRGLSPARR